MIPFEDRGAGQSVVRFYRVWLPVFLGLLMVAACVYVDYRLLPNTFRQIRSCWFTETTATIVSANLSEIRKNRHLAQEAHFAYVYLADGREYKGHNCTFLESIVSFRAQAVRYLEAFPKDSARPCFYDPTTPQNAVLIKGLQPHHWGLLIAVASVHFLALTALLSPWADFKKKAQLRPAGWRRNAHEKTECVCLSAENPSDALTMGLMLSASAAFVLGAMQTVAHPIVIFISGAIIAAICKRQSSRQNDSGKDDLCLNFRKRQISGPFGCFSFDNVDTLILDSIRIQGFRYSNVEWQLFIETRDGKEHLLKQTCSRAELVRLGGWLQDRLGR